VPRRCRDQCRNNKVSCSITQKGEAKWSQWLEIRSLGAQILNRAGQARELILIQCARRQQLELATDWFGDVEHGLALRRKVRGRLREPL